jgi:hypothetical protein
MAANLDASPRATPLQGRIWPGSLSKHPESIALRSLSSSQSIRGSAKARLSGVAPELSDPVGSLEVGEHEDVEQLGAGSRTESVQARPESAFELIGPHGRRLRRRTFAPVSACLSAYIHERGAP